jgi:F0F1-type ATP synthase membrane subunit c/vacuolar-type H+-ATPase subunit K
MSNNLKFAGIVIAVVAVIIAGIAVLNLGKSVVKSATQQSSQWEQLSK